MATDFEKDIDPRDYFDYLEDLRDSGVTNMFGAVPFLQEEFGLNQSDARFVLSSWIKSYGKEIE
jgi:hypothetical protein